MILLLFASSFTESEPTFDGQLAFIERARLSNQREIIPDVIWAISRMKHLITVSLFMILTPAPLRVSSNNSNWTRPLAI
jgi:hypothetical protein